MHIKKEKKDFIRRHYIAGHRGVQYLAERLELQAATVRFYLNEFRVIENQHPDKLQDYSFFIGKDKVTRATPWYNNFLRVMPGIVLAEPGPPLIADHLYEKYKVLCREEFSRPRFYNIFKRWFDEYETELSAAKLQAKFTPDELRTLKKWRKGNDRRLWQVSVVLMTVYTYNMFRKLAARIECTPHTALKWLRTYQAKGLEALSRPGNKKPVSAEKKAEIEKKMDDVVHMVRQSPKLYGIDKISWTITDLTTVGMCRTCRCCRRSLS